MLEYGYKEERSMEQKKIDITKTYNYSDDRFLSFRFVGDNPSVNIGEEQEKKESILDSIFSREILLFSDAMFQVVIKKIRTVFTNFQENYLEVAIGQYASPYGKTVKYRNGEIELYQSVQLFSNEKGEQFFQLKYLKDSGVSFSTTDDCKELGKDNYITQEIQQLTELHNIVPKKLDDTDQIICTIYRLFYQENPNFCRIEDKVKAISMFALLKEYNIYIGGNNKNYCFTLSGSRKMVHSSDLTLDLEQLAPFGEIQIGKVVLFSDSVKRVIELVGQEIRTQMEKQSNPIAWLIDFVKIDHVKKYCLSSRSNNQTIADYSNCSKDTVATTLRLIRKMNKKVNDSQNS